jgi:hypothetical protein
MAMYEIAMVISTTIHWAMNLDFDPALFVPVAVTAIGAPPIKQPAQKHAPFWQPAQMPEIGIAHAKPAIGGRKSR